MLFTILVAVLLTATVWAQAPQKMSYQAVIRDASNDLITSHAVGMRVSILQGTTPVYVETQATSTNANGLVSVEIGNGTFVSGVAFSAIDWSIGTYSIKTETDPAGGTNYTINGTSQLLSVPYALYAKNVENDVSGNTILVTDSISVITQNYVALTTVNVKANRVVTIDGFVNTTGSEPNVYLYDGTNSQWISNFYCIYEESGMGFGYRTNSTSGITLPYSANNKKFTIRFIPTQDITLIVQVKEYTATSGNGVGSAAIIVSQ